MITTRLVLLLALCITQVAAAADAPAKDRSKDSSALLQVQFAGQQRQLETAESELVQLRTEQAKVEAGLRQIQANPADAVRVRRALDEFKKNFTELQAALESGNRTAWPVLYGRTEKSLSRLETGDGWLEELPQWPHFSNAQYPNALLDELYTGGGGKYNLGSWELFSQLHGLYQPRSSQGAALYTDIKDAVEAAAGIVVGLSEEVLVKTFQDDHAKVTAVWTELATRIKAAISGREARIEEIRVRINSLSTELEERQIKKAEVDNQLNWAVPSMIFSLSLLFFLTRFFRPEIQAIIFQQRTLVEMVGMAFLLLTIIILGTDGKIDTSVLGTLLGTVGGYIFGQQVQARRNADTESPKPYTQPTQQAEAPRQPLPAIALPVVAEPVSALPPQAAAAVSLQQAAQQGELPTTPPPLK